MKHTIKIALAAMLAIGLFSPALAGSLEDAGAAKARGDYKAALVILRPVAERGDLIAQYELGELYADPGPIQDLPQAATWFRKAADQGYVRAQVMMGVMYAMGGGVTPDGARALYWFQKAADQGDAEGEAGVGQIYARGLGVAEDDAQAFIWFQKAADQRLMPAELNVAFDYENGRGVPKDKVQALMWLDLILDQILSGSSGGAHVSLQQRDKLAAQMSAAQIEQAKQLAVDWTAHHARLSSQSTP